MDGTTAVAIALQNYLTPLGVDKNVKILPATHGTPIDINKLKDKSVCFLDYSVGRETMDSILEIAKNVTVMDHHVSVYKELSEIEHPNFNYIYDVDKCGAQIAWREFIGGDEPYFVKLIGDRDLWTKQYSDSKLLNIALKVEEYDADKMVPLVTELVELAKSPDNTSISKETIDLLTAGRNYQKYHDKVVRDIASNAFAITLDDGTPAYKVNCPFGFISDVGEYLYNTHGVVAWMFNVGKYKVYNSLRVSDESDFDAAAYTRARGGGGHEKAAGWSVPV